MNKRFIIKPFRFFVVLSVILLVFQFNICKIVPVARYYDEVFLLICFCVFLNRKLQIPKSHGYTIVLIIITMFTGIIGNLLFSFQNNIIAIVADMLSVMKVPLIVLCFSLAPTREEIKYIIKRLQKFFMLYIYIAAIVAIYAYSTLNEFFFASERFGIGAYKFVSYNAGIFGYILMGAVCLLAIDIDNRNTKAIKNAKWIALVLIAMTTKGPQLIFVALYFFFYMFRLGRLRWYHIVSVVVIGLLLSGYQLQHYIKPTEARFALTVGGFRIARDFFPLGTGFGTFGSEMSKAYNYSQVYVLYNLDKIRGLGMDFTGYVTDNYWPMIIGQFGYIVAMMFLLFYLKLYNKINNIKNRSLESKQAFMTMFISFMVGSLGSAYLTAAEGVIDFVLLSLYLNQSGEI